MGKLQSRGMMPQDLKMQCSSRVLSLLIAGALLTGGFPFSAQAKSYSSGSGRSYSSHSSSSGSRSSSSSSHSSSSGSSRSSSSGGSSKSFSSGSGKSFSSGSSGSSSSSGSSKSSSSGSSGSGSKSPSSSGSSKSFSSSSGKSYSSGSSWSGNDRQGYSSTKSYSAGGGSKNQSVPSSAPTGTKAQSGQSGSSLTFDTAAARARKEEASKQEFTSFKQSQSPSPPPASGAGSYQAKPPPLPSTRDYSRPPTYAPTTVIIQTRPRRIYDVFSPYTYRPWVTYSDPYSSLFWWWLLDRSIEDQAWWAYHHRYDMDPTRYRALLANNQQLEARVAQLEAEQPPRDATYTPTGLDRDLMYSDQYVNRTYSNRSTTSGRVAFWIFAVPAAACGCVFFIWLIWFKRWQTT